MKRKLPQTGFGGMEFLLILAVILLLAGIGTYVYSKKKPAQPTQNTTATTATPQGTSTSPNGIPGGANAKVPPPSSTGAQNTIKFTAIGMQMNVPDSLRDLTYSSSSANGVTQLSFSTKKIEAAIPACAANQGVGAFDTISRGNGTYPGPANPASGGLLKQYSGYYFAYTLPNAPCAKNLSVENQNLLNALAQDFYGSLGSVQAL